MVGLLKPFKGRGNPLLTPYAVMWQVKRFPYFIFNLRLVVGLSKPLKGRGYPMLSLKGLNIDIQ